MEENKLYKINNWLFDPIEKTLISVCEHDSENFFCENLEAKQATLLLSLLKKQGSVLRRQDMVDEVWGSRYVDDRTINATISRLRKLLAKQPGTYIKTHPKLGYSIAEPIALISRKQPEQILVEQKEKKRFRYFNPLLIIMIFLLCFNLYWWSDQSIKNAISGPRYSTIEPITFLSGLTHSPSVSSNGKILAFVSSKNRKTPSSIILQSLDNNQTITLDTKTFESGSPAWSSKGSTLYYQTFEHQQCWINKVEVSNSLELSQQKQLVNCGNRKNFYGMSISQYDCWLYYTTKTDLHTPASVLRYSILDGITENITRPSKQHKGDEFPQINKDGDQLLFNRRINDDVMAVVVKDLINGSEQVIAETSYFKSPPTWTPSFQGVIYNQNQHVVMEHNLDDKTKEQLYASHKIIASPFYIDQETIGFTVGTPHKVETLTANILKNKIETKTLIKSPFIDFSASVSGAGENKKVTFVSNRSGDMQIWIKNNNSLKKITTFKQGTKISDLTFSHDGNTLLYKANQSLYMFDIINNKHTKLLNSKSKFTSTIWSCHSNNEILYVEVTPEQWLLKKQDLVTKKATILARNITSINSNCEQQSYYATSLNKNGIYPLSNEWELLTQHSYFDQVNVNNYKSWTIHKEQIYLLKDPNTIIIENIKNQTKSVISLDDVWTDKISISDDSLVVESHSFSDTYIGKTNITFNH